MGDRTGIAWTDSTWNPWRGCHKVSAGCAHCYMFREQTRYGRDPNVVVRTGPSTFNAPLKWPGPRLVFTCSWSDFFIEEADAWRPEAWEIIHRTPSLTYQVLTKRPERIADHLPPDWGPHGYPNVWLGTSIERAEFGGRWRTLRGIPAHVRFISAEPLLGSLVESEALNEHLSDPFLPRPDWIIVGGESGPAARPMDERWLFGILGYCDANRVPFFLKQLGGYPDPRSHGKAILGGRTWTEMPAGYAAPTEVPA